MTFNEFLANNINLSFMFDWHNAKGINSTHRDDRKKFTNNIIMTGDICFPFNTNNIGRKTLNQQGDLLCNSLLFSGIDITQALWLGIVTK